MKKRFIYKIGPKRLASSSHDRLLYLHPGTGFCPATTSSRSISAQPVWPGFLDSGNHLKVGVGRWASAWGSRFTFFHGGGQMEMIHLKYRSFFQSSETSNILQILPLCSTKHNPTSSGRWILLKKLPYRYSKMQIWCVGILEYYVASSWANWSSLQQSQFSSVWTLVNLGRSKFLIPEMEDWNRKRRAKSVV